MTLLGEIESALIDASNRLAEIDCEHHPRYTPLDEAIDNALRLVQAWREEDEGR